MFEIQLFPFPKPTKVNLSISLSPAPFVSFVSHTSQCSHSIREFQKSGASPLTIALSLSLLFVLFFCFFLFVLSLLCLFFIIFFHLVFFLLRFKQRQRQWIFFFFYLVRPPVGRTSNSGEKGQRFIPAEIKDSAGIDRNARNSLKFHPRWNRGDHYSGVLTSTRY